MAALVLVLSLLGGALWVLRRRSGIGALTLSRPRDRRVECLERVALGPQHALHLVRLGDRGLLVASFPAGCALLRDCAWRDLNPEAKS